MKTRIEILVDVDIAEDQVESFRKYLEDATWGVMPRFMVESHTCMVQANESTEPKKQEHRITITSEAEKPYSMQKYNPSCSCGWRSFMPYFSYDNAVKSADRHVNERRKYG